MIFRAEDKHIEIFFKQPFLIARFEIVADVFRVNVIRTAASGWVGAPWRMDDCVDMNPGYVNLVVCREEVFGHYNLLDDRDRYLSGHGEEPIVSNAIGYHRTEGVAPVGVDDGYIRDYRGDDDEFPAGIGVSNRFKVGSNAHIVRAD